MRTWKDITLRQAIEIDQLGDMEEVELIINQMAIIRDTTTDKIESLSPAEFIAFTNDYKFMGNIPAPKLVKSFKRDGIKYQMITLSDINLAQMVDIEEYYTDGFLKNAHKILSVLYLPIKKKWIFGKATLEDYVPDIKREEMFLDMDMQFVWQNLIFFWNIAKIYTSGLTDYSVEEMKTAISNLKMGTLPDKEALETDKQSKPKSDNESGTGSE